MARQGNARLATKPPAVRSGKNGLASILWWRCEFERCRSGGGTRCVAARATMEETADLMRKAVQMHLAGMREDGDPIPEPSTIAEYITAA